MELPGRTSKGQGATSSWAKKFLPLSICRKYIEELLSHTSTIVARFGVSVEILNLTPSVVDEAEKAN